LAVIERKYEMNEYEVSVYVHIRAVIEAESDSESDILDALFPDGWVGEIDSVSTDTNFLPKGYIECISEEDDSEGDE
jgi:hypothetical protein